MYVGRKRSREESPEYAMDHFPDINCVMHTTLRSQQRGETEHIVREVLADIVLKAAMNADLCTVKEVLKWDYSLPLYTMIAKGQVAATCDVTDSIVGNLSADEQQFFSKNIKCTEAESIAAETIAQGNCSRFVLQCFQYACLLLFSELTNVLCWLCLYSQVVQREVRQDLKLAFTSHHHQEAIFRVVSRAATKVKDSPCTSHPVWYATSNFVAK